MRVLNKYNLEDFLFLDIETVQGEENFKESSHTYDAWRYDKLKETKGSTEQELIELYNTTAGLYAEYGKIVCVTIGIIRNGETRIKSFFGDNEKVLLTEFNEMLETFVNNKTWLCGHAVTGFDAPYIMKRCLINGLPINQLFDAAHLKPWEVQYMDTMTLWKSTGWRVSSLSSIVSAFGLPSPKDDISGADVSKAYYKGDLDRIVTYCEKDVNSVISIVKKMRGDIDTVPTSIPVIDEHKGILTYLFEGGKYNKDVKEKLKDALSKLSKTDLKIAVEILNTIPTKAKGKQTYITKKDIKELVDGS